MNITEIAAILRAIVSLLPAVLDAIKAIEAAIPTSGQGAAKLEAMHTLVQSVYSTADKAAPTFDVLWPHLQAVANTFVALYNKLGWK